MSGSYFVTAPIYYANGEPHIGHTYTTILADTLVRWHRLHGREAFSVSGTDEHGEKMVEVAARNGETPRQLVDRIAPIFVDTWNELGIAPSRFVRTTSPEHFLQMYREIGQALALHGLAPPRLLWAWYLSMAWLYRMLYGLLGDRRARWLADAFRQATFREARYSAPRE